MTAAAQIFRFPGFEFSTKRQELRKGTLRVRMSASQIRLLVLFLERPGELITRDEIASRIWSDTATIDVANGVNTAINRLRFSLGDQPGSPRYLETVIGLGYRFIAPVERELEDAAVLSISEGVRDDETFTQEAVGSAPEISQPPVEPPRGLPRWAVWGIFAGLLVVGLLGLTYFRPRSNVHLARSGPKLIAVTRVTANNGGRKITAAALSSDGKLLALADPSGIRIQKLGNHQEYSLGTLPASLVNQLSWFPNGDELLVSGRDIDSNLSTVWLVAATGVATSVLAVGADLGTVSPDGNKIAFTRAGGAEIWLTDHDGLGSRRLLQAEAKDIFSFLLWSPDSKRLMVVSHKSRFELASPAAGNLPKPAELMSPNDAGAQQSDHWAWNSVDVATGKRLAHEENTPMVSAVMSPTGTVQFVTATLHGSVFSKGNVFSVRTDPTTGRFLEAPVHESSFAAHNASAITSSSDGSKIAFIATTMTADILIASLRDDGGGKPSLTEIHRLTSSLADTYPHAWSPDGTIIYEAPYQNHLAIFGRHDDGSTALLAQLPVDAAMAQLTPDGRWILFLAIESDSINIYRVPVRGGVPERVPGAAGLESEISCARRGPIACVLRRKDIEHGVPERHYYAFDPITGIGALLAHTPWVPVRRGDWSVSPDGTMVAVANRDAIHPAVSLLRLNGASTYDRVIPISGHSAPLGAGWAPDGKALFIEVRTANGFTLLYKRLDGQPQVLRESASLIWAVPSPDGKEIAFPESAANANVWVSDFPPRYR